MADPEPESPCDVSVIVPVHRGADTFPRCLAALGRSVPPPAEVIVVCDGEANDLADLARAQGCRVLEVPGPRGPARARNAAARAAVNPILFFIDSDVEVAPGSVAKVSAHFQRDPALTALFGSYDTNPGAPSFLSQYRNLLHHFVHQNSAENASTFWGACGAIRREAFLGASGFDETYTEPSFEDVELGYRLAKTGHRILLDKTLQVKHLKHWGLVTMLRTDVLRRALPWGTLILEGRVATHDLNLDRSSRWSVILVASLLAGLVGAIWHAWFLIACLLPAGALVALNRGFYRFLFQKRGALFALRAIPCHWVFYFCGGLGFGLALLKHLVTAPRR